MPDTHRTPPHTLFAVFAVLLGIVTYLETVMLEYPLRWLGPGASLAALVAMVAVQLALCAALYRHLRRHADAYSTFFSRATLVALAAYVALTALFLFPHGASLMHRDLSGVAALPWLALVMTT